MHSTRTEQLELKHALDGGALFLWAQICYFRGVCLKKRSNTGDCQRTHDHRSDQPAVSEHNEHELFRVLHLHAK